MGSITVWFGLKTSKPSSFPNYFFEKTFQKNIMNKNPDPRLGPIFDVAFGTNYGAPPPANGSNNGSAHPNPHFDPNVAYFHVHMAEKDKLVNQLLSKIKNLPTRMVKSQGKMRNCPLNRKKSPVRML